MSDDRKKITLFVEPEVHKAAAVKLAQLGGKPAGYSYQSVLETLLAEWAQGKREAAPVDRAPGSERYREDIERLVRVLEGGTPADRVLIRGMLNMADDAQSKRDKAAGGSPGNPSRSNRPAREQRLSGR